MHLFKAKSLILIVLLACCNSEDGSKEAINAAGSIDFPGEELKISQSTCQQLTGDDLDPNVTVNDSEEEIKIDIKNISFSCNEEIAASLIIIENQASVTIHPVEMNPKTATKCSCPYNLSTSIPKAKGTFDSLKVFKQFSNYGGPSEPVLVTEQKF